MRRLPSFFMTWLFVFQYMKLFVCLCLDVPVESLRLRFALLQSLNNTLESFFLPLVELRQTQTYQNSIAALLCEAKGEQRISTNLTGKGDQSQP